MCEVVVGEGRSKCPGKHTWEGQWSAGICHSLFLPMRGVSQADSMAGFKLAVKETRSKSVSKNWAIPGQPRPQELPCHLA